MFQTALPVLGVSSSTDAENFYCGQLGFRRSYVHRPNSEKADPCWMPMSSSPNEFLMVTTWTDLEAPAA